MAEQSKIRFVCGKQTFTLKRDLDTGTWDHNSHDLKVVHRYQGDGKAANFKIVEVICEMLSDCLTTPERGVAAAKKLWKIANGERPHILEVVPEVVIACLKMGNLDQSVVELWTQKFSTMSSFARSANSSAEFESWSKLGYLRFEPDVKEGEWLRQAMVACDAKRDSVPIDDHGFNPELVVAIAALNMGSAWRQDLKLWPDYLEWACRYPPLKAVAAAALPNLYGDSERSRLAETPLYKIIVNLDGKDRHDFFGQPAGDLWQVLSVHTSGVDDLLRRDKGNFGLRMVSAANLLWAVRNGGAKPRFEARQRVAWSLALSELRAACSEAGGIVLAGRGQTPLQAVFEEAWKQADSILRVPARSEQGSQWALDMVQCIRNAKFPVPQFEDDYQAVFNDF